MKVWTCTKFTGHWPAGCAAVIVAPTPESAANVLNASLQNSGLPGDASPDEMMPLVTDYRNAVILCDGNY